MVINCFYDECDEYSDIIYIPDSITNIGEIQEQFFKWMFDKNNDHKYWVVIDSEKKYCQYGIQAFIDWVNNNIIVSSDEKSYILEKNATVWDEHNESIFF